MSSFTIITLRGGQLEKDKTIKHALVFIAVILFFWVLKTCSSFILPLAIALFVFMLVSPLMEKLRRIGLPNILSIAIILVLSALFCLGLVYIIIAMINIIMTELPSYITKVAAFDEYVSDSIRETFKITREELPSIITVLNIDWTQQVKNLLTSLSSASASILGDLAMVIVYLLFLLMEQTTIFPKVRAAFPESRREMQELAKNISQQTSRYLSVKLLISLITGLCFYLISFFSGMDFPIVWGILAFLLNFIPTIGSIIITVLATFMAAIQFMPHWGQVFLVFFLFLATEMILGNVIDPKLQGAQLNMSPLMILVMLAVWGYVWGIVGMFLAVPITCILQIVCATIPSFRPLSIILSSGANLEKDKGR